MLGLLGADSELHEQNSDLIPQRLIDELRQGFREVDGCIVPRSYACQSIFTETHPRINNIHDETGIECLLSKVHIDDLAGAGTSLSQLARIGRAYACPFERLSSTLRYSVTSESSSMLQCETKNWELGPLVRFDFIEFAQINPG